MVEIKEQFIVDKKGNRTGVLISIDDYDSILEDLEELYAIRAYDAAKASKDEAVPFRQAVKEIEQNRQ